MNSRSFIFLFAALICPATMLAAPKGNATAGKQVYTAHCQMCHGSHGQGNPGLAKMLGTAIPPLTSKKVQDLSDAQMGRVIEHGEGKMSPVNGLSSTEVDNVIAFVRSLPKK